MDENTILIYIIAILLIIMLTVSSYKEIVSKLVNFPCQVEENFGNGKYGVIVFFRGELFFVVLDHIELEENIPIGTKLRVIRDKNNNVCIG